MFELSEDNRQWEACGDEDHDEACSESLAPKDNEYESSEKELSNNDLDFEDLCKPREEHDDLPYFDEDNEYFMIHSYSNGPDGKTQFLKGAVFNDVHNFRKI